VQTIALSPLLLAPKPDETLGGYFIAAPFLIVGMTVLNLPVVGSALRRFRLPMATRRNHALEHATILVLEASRNRRLGGRAQENGFRLYGKVTEQQIREAFEEVCRTIRPLAVLMFFSLRRRLGNALQRRYFMATDFVDVSLWGIRREPADLAWGVPVHFVKTEVRLAVRSPR
jgi:hypothetical protein